MVEVWIKHVVRYVEVERDNNQAKALKGGGEAEAFQVAADAAGWLYDRFCERENELVDLNDDVIEMVREGVQECNLVDCDGPLSHYAGMLNYALDDLVEEMTEYFRSIDSEDESDDERMD